MPCPPCDNSLKKIYERLEPFEVVKQIFKRLSKTFKPITFYGQLKKIGKKPLPFWGCWVHPTTCSTAVPGPPRCQSRARPSWTKCLSGVTGTMVMMPLLKDPLQLQRPSLISWKRKKKRVIFDDRLFLERERAIKLQWQLYRASTNTFLNQPSTLVVILWFDRSIKSVWPDLRALPSEMKRSQTKSCLAVYLL